MAFKETVRSVLKVKGGAVWSVSPETSVFNALILMAEKEVGALIVVSEGRLVGMFSERDYARKLILHGKSSRDTLVREVMTSQVVTVTPEQNVQECMKIMTHHRIRHLPVLDGDRLEGVISIGDLVNSIISAQAETIHQLSSYIAGKYPG
jgi:CBS domain-containing protein